MPDYGKRTGRDAFESLERRLASAERELRRGRGGGLSTFDRGDTLTQPAPVEGQTMVQYDTDEPWYYANGEWRDFCCPITSGTAPLSDRILGLTGLSAFWKLNEAAGATAALDSSGNNYHLNVITDTPSFGQTGVGIGPTGEQSVYLDGDASHGDMLDRATTPAAMTDNFTVFGWLRRWAPAYGLEEDTIVARETSGSGWRLAMHVVDNRKLRLLVNNTAVAVSDNVLALSTWYMWAAVRNAGAWTLYVDGVKQAATATATPVASAGFHIGAYNRVNTYFQGHQSYVALVNGVLSDSQVADLHAAAGSGGWETAGKVLAADGAGGTTWAYPAKVWVNGA